MLQPLGKRIFIETIPEDEKLSTVLLIAKEPTVFKVVAIGEDVTKVNIGDIILLGAYGMQKLEFKGVTYSMVFEENVIAKEVV